ncbi:CinA family nicotinamide mononucleotide deamidase-related protein [Thalassotalea sp. 1_MG-2023]|uniref:CinA family nicotinamide mononucleotide deamidase-related protein n=1 Tax=Thalassotalea sp. 1_MG-2023 TaxID=3062680 RepID=UPI0026E22510|nr:CinA family nicotinamide mononucleotide deamidase-related protein [Thalassotalea sp. 1_MG-2023]MDO6428788.1 CinA family nicotinamide mononucleotide deamidase-related protein [Thalassotalea sp. 1_MG-2023]
MSTLNIQLLLTGDEIMNGDIVDSNSAMIAQQLIPFGLQIVKKTTVSDDLSLLIEAINTLSQQADILIINGGLGPTVDDLTAQALASAINVPIEKNHQAYQHVLNWCDKKNYPITDASIKQAMLPKGVNIIANEIGSAVGFSIVHHQCHIFCTPGVPRELALMLEKHIIPQFTDNVTQKFSYQVRKFQVFGIGESSIQQLINNNFPEWPAEISLGFRACTPMLEVKLATHSKNNLPLLQQWQDKILHLLGDHVLCQFEGTPPTMAEHVLSLLQEKNFKVTTAESCTGGLIASLLTDISGASESFEAGFVTYSNLMKHRLLDVPEELLLEHGAVSEPVVKAMVKGAINKSNADFGIAVSGIAGPNGGSKEKPVGTVWIAWGTSAKIRTITFIIKGDRESFQISVAHRALDLLRREILMSKQTPMYKK